MTDTENVFDGFALLGDDEEFDVDKIFGSSSDEPAPPPPAPEPAKEVKPQPEPKQEFPTKTQKVPAEEANQSLELFSAFADAESDPVPLPPADTEKTQLEPEQVQMETAEVQPEPEQTLPAKTQEVPAEEKQPLELFSAFTGAESDPIPEAAPVKSIAPRPQTQLSLFDKPPVFQYGGAREQITDASMTFEALRIQKADDFPELEDASAVTWQVRYGDITKTVPAPKTDTIAAMKAEIEKSKAFLDGLKKGKVKDPECVVKPQIRMQKKGIADYKGVFPTLEAARASNKVICLIPARDGQTYEMRRSELGEFIAPKHKITEFSEVRAGFRPALPRIPQSLMRAVLAFFRSQMESGAEFEALVRIYWDRKEQKFIPFVPKQRVTKDRVTVRLTDEDLPDDTRYLYYADMKIKRFIRFFAVIVILSILLSMTSFAAQMRASKYLSVYGATITKTSDGNYSIYFNVTAPSRMEHLGVSRISVQRYTGSYWRTEYNYTYPETAELQGENVGRYSATIVYEPQYSNSNYRAVLTFYAANASGSDTGTYTAD